jgi:flagellar motor switch protein FliN
MTDNQLTRLLNRAEQGIDAVLSDEPADFAALDLQPVELRIELGRTHLPPEEVQTLRSGAVVSLAGQLGEPAAIYAGDQLFGRGEVVVIDGKIGVRIVELAGNEVTR